MIIYLIPTNYLDLTINHVKKRNYVFCFKISIKIVNTWNFLSTIPTCIQYHTLWRQQLDKKRYKPSNWNCSNIVYLCVTVCVTCCLHSYASSLHCAAENVIWLLARFTWQSKWVVLFYLSSNCFFFHPRQWFLRIM